MSEVNFKIEKSGDKKAELIIYDVIGPVGISSKDVIEQLKALGDVEEINVRINSPGGSAFHGIAIYNALERHPAKKIVHIDAVAASAAALIAMAASPGELRIAANAEMMIHNGNADTAGDKNDLNRMIERLRSLDDIQASTFAKRMKASKSEIVSMMDSETWFTAPKAVAAGLADVVTAEVKIAACASDLYSQFKNLPAELAAQLKNGDIEMTEQEIQALVATSLKAAIDPIKAEHTSAIAQLKAEHATQIAALGKKEPPKKDDEATAPTETEIRAQERTRTKDLGNLFASAGFKDSAVLDGWIEKGTSILEAKAQVGDLLIKQNKVVGDDHSGGGDDANDPKAKYRAEYSKDKAIYAQYGITNVDDYIESRMVDDGLAVLAPKKTSSAA